MVFHWTCLSSGEAPSGTPRTGEIPPSPHHRSRKIQDHPDGVLGSAAESRFTYKFVTSPLRRGGGATTLGNCRYRRLAIPTPARGSSLRCVPPADPPEP